MIPKSTPYFVYLVNMLNLSTNLSDYGCGKKLPKAAWKTQITIRLSVSPHSKGFGPCVPKIH